MNRTIRGGLLLLTVFVLAGVGACIDLIPVEPPALKPAGLNLILQLQNVASGPSPDLVSVAISATLDPGIDGRGRPHRVIDDTMWVGDRGFAMLEVGPAGRRMLIDTLRLSSAAVWDDPISLRPPRLEGIDASLAALTWPRARKLGPDTIHARLGGPVELTLSPPSAAATSPSEQRWSVSFQRKGRWFGFGEDGPVPSTIRIPPDLLDQADVGSFAVFVFVDQSGSLPPMRTDYRAHLAVHQMVRWVVSVAPH